MPVPPLRIAVNGAAGRMGQRVVALTTQDPALSLVAAIDSPRSPVLGLDAGEKAGVGQTGVAIRPALDVEADVVIDFSMPDGLVAIAEACRDRKVRVIQPSTALRPPRAIRRHAPYAEKRKTGVSEKTPWWPNVMWNR